MKKKDFITLILSTIGGILFALGLCMALLPEWNAMTPGIVIGIVGAVILLIMVLVRRKMDGKPTIVFSGKAIGTSPYDHQLSDANFALFHSIFDHCEDIRRSGSAALDLAYVAAGRLEGFLERNLKPWDFAAGILLVEEAGGRVSDYQGQTPYPLQNADIVTAAPAVFDELLELAKA